MTDEKVKNEALSPSAARAEKRRLIRAKKRTGLIFLASVSALGGFLFSGTALPFNTYPLGLCLVAASKNYSVFAFCGVLIRLIFEAENRALYLPAILSGLAFSLRLLFSFLLGKHRRFSVGGTFALAVNDDISVRVLIATLSYVMIAISGIITGGTFYEVFAGVFGTLAVALFTFLFAFAGDMKYADSGARDAGLASLVFSAVLSLAGAEIFTISVSLVAAYIITLYVGYLGSGTGGALTGLLVGLAAGGNFAVLFAFAGLAAGVFYEVSPIVAALVSVGITVCGGIYTLGVESLIDFLPEIVIAALIITTLALFRLLPSLRESRAGKYAADTIRDILFRKKEAESSALAGERADMLFSLSETIKGMSESFRLPDRDGLSLMAGEVIESICATCPKYNSCTLRGSESVIAGITENLMRRGKIADKSGKTLIGETCENAGQMICAVNARAAKLLEDAATRDKSSIFAFDYDAAAKIIADALARSDAGYTADIVLSDKLTRAFKKSGIYAENTVVCGERKKYVIATGRDVLRSREGAADIKSLCELICGGVFTSPEYIIDEKSAAMTLESIPMFSVEYAARQSAKSGERVCGDAVGVARAREGYFYGFICDGMGSGESAEFTAGICKTFLEKMLSCGNKKSTTLDMINMFISSKNTECFSTVDLLEVDLFGGIASFTKSGAAASYIVRSGRVFKISSNTMPIGILPEVSAQITDFALCDGDIIVMCSDGVCHDPEMSEDENSLHIVDLLENASTDNIEKMAESLLLDASFFNKRSDDMSAMVVKIKKVGDRG